MKNITTALLACIITFYASAQTTRVDSIITAFKQANSTYILVVAHRGDWRNYPENSIAAIKGAVKMGVDIVEIDIQKTKDGQLVLMHDETIDRTTNGKGKVSDYTLDSLRKFFLKNGVGRVTSHPIPTLEEAMLAVKGSAMVNLDKCYNFMNEAYAVLVKTGTLSHAIFKGYNNAEKVRADYGAIVDKVTYMPMVKLEDTHAENDIATFQQTIKPVAFELIYNSDTAQILNRLAFIKQRGSRVWINALWASLDGGHDDDKAMEENNIKDSWQWLLDRGANVIQTDWPKELLAYLRLKKLHR